MNLAESTLITYVPYETQQLLVEQVREVIKVSPLVRPRTPGGLPMRVRVTSAGHFGWVGDGEYRYTDRDRTGNPWPSIPSEWRSVADMAWLAACDRFGTGLTQIYWDSAIVNWFDPDASLGWHQDLAERDRTLPIVTISLGDTASWAVKDADGTVSRVRLESGAVTVLAGSLRLAPHTIERIIPNEMFSPIRDEEGNPVRGRISITLRRAG